LNRNYLIDRVWQAHVEGRDRGFSAQNLMLHAELSELWTAQQDMNRWWIEWSATQCAMGLTVRFGVIGGDASTMTRGAILLHVVNRATYHRGWIADMFQVPAKNPTTDLRAPRVSRRDRITVDRLLPRSRQRSRLLLVVRSTAMKTLFTLTGATTFWNVRGEPDGVWLFWALVGHRGVSASASSRAAGVDCCFTGR
jgi:hypothetical protein